MRKLLLAALANTLFSAAALAQQAVPLDRVPEGRRVPGWAVDEIPLNVYRDRSPIDDYFGKRGLSTTSYAAAGIQVYSPDDNVTVHYGRGILKIEQNGEVIFSLSGSVKRNKSDSKCDFKLRVSNKDVISGGVNPYRATPSIGSINLSPGYFPMEYVLRCQLVKEGIYVIKMRGVNDLGPRIFTDAELFHVAR